MIELPKDKSANRSLPARIFFPGSREHARKWLRDPVIAGGGAIADVGVHCIDALRYILQDEVVRVSTSGITEGSNGVDLAAIMTLGFTRGTLGTVLVSYIPEYRTPMEFTGDGGTLFAIDGLTVDHPVQLELRRGGKIVESETVSNHLAYARQVDAFAAAVEGKAKFRFPAKKAGKIRQSWMQPFAA